eukprot:TRINITY_DN91881_c0_g1_i1.p1 TRINITY_DN91881_c0_g1~~TRINITY_DN91881_c0_g1_i1.p1  ORF type:complete len:257 (-),score=45.92 TRINITY_DN91881_c0_g1_i1:110-880(-)
MARQPLFNDPAVVALSEHEGGAPAQQIMTTDKITSMSAQQVAQMIAKNGFADYAHVFQEHNISGPRLLLLGADELREMGIRKVGDRLGIQQMLLQLQSAARAVWRSAAIAEHEEAYPHPLWHYWIHTCCGACPLQMDRYKLTHTQLKVTHKHSAVCCGRRCSCFGVRVENDMHPLDQIVDVDTTNIQDGCCSPALTRISCHMSHMSQGDAVGHREGGGYEQRPTAELVVPFNDGENFAAQIRNAVEEYKQNRVARR